MWLFYGVILSLIIKDSVLGYRTVFINERDSFTFRSSSDTNLDEVTSCQLKPPYVDKFSFNQGDVAASTDKFKVVDGKTKCEVTAKNIDESDAGFWIHITFNNHVPDDYWYRFMIIVKDSLPEQEITKVGEVYSIAINSNASIEAVTCFLQTPDEVEHVLTEQINIPGVTMLQGQSVDCGIILHTTSESMAGRWKLVARGTKVNKDVRVERIQPFVLRLEDSSEEEKEEIPIINNVEWIVGDSVNMTIGSANTVYCKIVDNNGHTRLDNFGQCRIVVDRVTLYDKGIWKMYISSPGTVELQLHNLNVRLQERASDPAVISTVDDNGLSVMLTCSIPVEHKLDACKFREPIHHNIFVAAAGETQNVINGAAINFETDSVYHKCTLRLTETSLAGNGIWRCGMETSSGTYYGFVPVGNPVGVGPSDLADSSQHNANLEPERGFVHYMEDESVVMRCSIPTKIKYCYFRAANNGTIFNVFPNMPSTESFEYVGAGFDAGECGIRINNLTPRDAGDWSCRVGIVNDRIPSIQLAHIRLVIAPKVTVRQFWETTFAYQHRRPRLVINGYVYNSQPIEYCRFVKINGGAFTSYDAPDGYQVQSSLQGGDCTLYINNPEPADLHPWFIAFKLVGQDGEISRMTRGVPMNIVLRPNLYSGILFWLMIFIICSIPIMVASALVPKKNREYIGNRANGLRNSVRSTWNNTFVKKAPTPSENTNQPTP